MRLCGGSSSSVPSYLESMLSFLIWRFLKEKKEERQELVKLEDFPMHLLDCDGLTQFLKK